MNKIQRQLVLYSLIGVSAVALDGAIYFFFLKVVRLPLSVAKLLGVVCSVVYGYVLNCRQTFCAKISARSLAAYCVVYGISIAQNIFTNAVLAARIPERFFPLIGAFLVATFISVCMNFLGMKFWVFRED